MEKKTVIELGSQARSLQRAVDELIKAADSGDPFAFQRARVALKENVSPKFREALDLFWKGAQGLQGAPSQSEGPLPHTVPPSVGNLAPNSVARPVTRAPRPFERKPWKSVERTIQGEAWCKETAPNDASTPLADQLEGVPPPRLGAEVQKSAEERHEREGLGQARSEEHVQNQGGLVAAESVSDKTPENSVPRMESAPLSTPTVQNKEESIPLPESLAAASESSKAQVPLADAPLPASTPLDLPDFDSTEFAPLRKEEPEKQTGAAHLLWAKIPWFNDEDNTLGNESFLAFDEYIPPALFEVAKEAWVGYVSRNGKKTAVYHPRVLVDLLNANIVPHLDGCSISKNILNRNGYFDMNGLILECQNSKNEAVSKMAESKQLKREQDEIFQKIKSLYDSTQKLPQPLTADSWVELPGLGSIDLKTGIQCYSVLEEVQNENFVSRDEYLGLKTQDSLTQLAAFVQEARALKSPKQVQAQHAGGWIAEIASGSFESKVRKPFAPGHR